MRPSVFVASCVTLLLSLTSCTNVNGGNTSSSTDTIKYEYKTAHFIQKNDKIEDSSLLFRSSIIYPLIDNKQNAILADSINTFIQYSTFGGYRTAEEATKAFVEDCIKQTTGEEGLSMLGWESIDSISIAGNMSSAVSLRRMHYSYTGGAHGNPSESYVSFATNNGKRLKFEDIVEKGKLSELETINITHLKLARNIKEQSTLEESGLFVKGDKVALPSSFALTRKGLLIAYDYYEIASYADGVISYIIPFNKLKDILKDEFILAE